MHLLRHISRPLFLPLPITAAPKLSLLRRSIVVTEAVHEASKAITGFSFLDSLPGEGPTGPVNVYGRLSATPRPGPGGLDPINPCGVPYPPPRVSSPPPSLKHGHRQTVGRGEGVPGWRCVPSIARDGSAEVCRRFPTASPRTARGTHRTPRLTWAAQTPTGRCWRPREPNEEGGEAAEVRPQPTPVPAAILFAPNGSARFPS